MPPEGSGLPELGASPQNARRALRARLDLSFAADGDGRSYLKRQFAAYPFHVCRALYQDPDQPGFATLYIQSCSGGVYEDDELRMDFAAEGGARVHVSTQAATVVHSMPSSRASQRVTVRCEPGAYFEYLPDPQILFPRARFRSEIAVTLRGDGVALVSDSFLCHDPDAGGGTFDDYFNEIMIEDENGATLAVDRLKVGGEVFAAARPGAFGAYTAQATIIVAGRRLPTDTIVSRLKQANLEGAVSGVSQLPQNAGLIVRLLAIDGCALAQGLHGAWSAVRIGLLGAPPRQRRK